MIVRGQLENCTYSGGDKRGGMHTNERSHGKLIIIGSNGLYGRR